MMMSQNLISNPGFFFCIVPIHNSYLMTLSIQSRSRPHSLMVISFGARICALASEQHNCNMKILPIHLPTRTCPETYDTTTHHQGAINVLIKAISSLLVIFVVSIFLCSMCLCVCLITLMPWPQSLT